MQVDPDTLRLASRRVPRYTSYPTAMQFSSDVGAETYRAWLAALAPDTELSVYLHVPFCEHLCFYCGCHTRAERNRAVKSDYSGMLRDEIAMVSGCLPDKMTVGRVHWGGGTPTELGGRGLEDVIGKLKDAFRFNAHLEHAIELDPRRLNPALVRSLAHLGINRVSLGVQTFDPTVQAAIGRVQPYDQVAEAVGWLRDCGIEAISFDLMYGLPHQTEASVADTAEKALSLRPRRISAFGYAHVPWMKKNQGGMDAALLPGAQERLAQMTAIREALMANGYEAIGFDHFALPDDPLALSAKRGELKRNFQGYTNDASLALLGFGASAIGRLPSGYVQNTSDARAYASAVSEHLLPVSRGRALTAEDRVRGALIEDTLCRGGAELTGDVPEDVRGPALAQLLPLVGRGLVAFDGRRFRITAKGWPFARLIASAFDGYLADNPRGHSLAV